MHLDTLPAGVLKQVVVPQNESDAATLVRTYLGEDRVGPANTHQNDPDGMFKQAMAGPNATPPPLTTPINVDAVGYGEWVGVIP